MSSLYILLVTSEILFHFLIERLLMIEYKDKKGLRISAIRKNKEIFELLV